MSCRPLALLAAALVALASCGGDARGKAEPVLVNQIPAAVRAVEARLGGTQRYSEINATPSEVNLFVVGADGVESAFVYREGKLEPPPAGQPTSAPTFAAADMAFEPGAVVDQVAKELPHAAVLAFSVQPGSGTDAPTQLIATVQSAEGGQISVLVGPSGQILAARPQP